MFCRFVRFAMEEGIEPVRLFFDNILFETIQT